MRIASRACVATANAWPSCCGGSPSPSARPGSPSSSGRPWPDSSTPAALGALWRARPPGDPPAPAPASPEWVTWLQGELARPLHPDCPPPSLPPEAAETLGMFRLIRELRDELDREAIGSFVLSMTHE